MFPIELFASQIVLGQPAWLWLAFLFLVGLLLAFDLGVLHRKERIIGVRESLWLSAGYVAVACAFGAWVWSRMGGEAGLAFFTGYFVEKSLSLDNVFVISLIFASLAVPRQYQHRVLFWGILGAIVMRGIMIGLGSALVSNFSWVLYVFGAFLVFTGVKMLFASDAPHDIENSAVLKLARRHFRVTSELHGNRFVVRQPAAKGGPNVLHLTPLMLALVMVEGADLVFAVDSVPAIFAITTDTFIVFTSNIFAILGLRALYFALAAMIHRFVYLKYALAAVLVFIGGKIFWSHAVAKVDPLVSLGVTAALLSAGVVVSLARTAKEPART